MNYTLDDFKEIWNGTSANDILNQFYYEHIELQKALKRIADLQQENERLRTRIKTIKRLRKKQTAKKNKYKVIIFNEERALHDYKSRCEKASEILNNIYMLDNVTITNNACEKIDNAINILQNGSDSQ